MPFKSKAQRRKFAELLVKGEISPETYEEWNRETGRKILPERVKKKTAKKKEEGAQDDARPQEHEETVKSVPLLLCLCVLAASCSRRSVELGFWMEPVSYQSTRIGDPITAAELAIIDRAARKGNRGRVSRLCCCRHGEPVRALQGGGAADAQDERLIREAPMPVSRAGLPASAAAAP